MDSESLRTASTYLNNLLLARGLLRNSEPVDFVKPSRESRAQIINLVHDLILREDRDKDSREHVAFTLRQLRAESARKDHEIEALRLKNEENARKVVQAQAAERAAKEECKKVERSMKSLQDQTARLKGQLAQVKTQCNNDVRKRDLELARLKTHLQGQQRGNKAAVTAPSITITGGARRQQQGQPAFDASVRGLDDPEYSLKQETTEFLTQLSQSLSDENDQLISLVRGTLSTLRGLLGLPTKTQKLPDSAVGSRGSSDDMQDSDGNLLHALPTSYDRLASDVDSTLSHLKTILTNPNFVSMEEVEVREEEIVRLHEGWERMEQRWKDVLLMMDGWRKRMDTGDTINIDDLRQGMGLVSPERVRNVELGAIPGLHEQDASFAEGEVSEIRLPSSDGAVQEPSLVFESQRSTRSMRSTRSAVAKSSPKRKRDILEPPEFFDLRPPTGRKALAPASPQLPQLELEEEGYEVELEPVEASGLSDEPHMTVQEKLSAAAREAKEAAAARVGEQSNTRIEDYAKSSTSRSRSKKVALNDEPGAFDGVFSPVKGITGGFDGAVDELQDEDTLGKMPSPVKKTRIRGRPRKRKSTLSREEMDALVLAAGED